MNIHNTKELDNTIALLKNKKREDAIELKNIFNETVDTLKPKNLIKSAIKNATEGSSVGGLLLKTAAGIGTNLLDKKIKVGNANSIVAIATNTITAGVASTVLQNADKIMAWSTAIVNSFSKKKKIAKKNIVPQNEFIL
jgi:hypothetical protein